MFCDHLLHNWGKKLTGLIRKKISKTDWKRNQGWKCFSPVDRTRIIFSALGFQAVPQTKESPRLKATTRKYLNISLHRRIELRAQTTYTTKNRDRRTRQSAWQQKWNFSTIPTAKKKSDLKLKNLKANKESISLLPTHDANTQHEARNPSQTSATCTNGAAREDREERETGRRKASAVSSKTF